MSQSRPNANKSDELHSGSLEFVEQLLDEFERDPSALGPDWQRYFEELAGGPGNGRLRRAAPKLAPRSIFHSAPLGGDGRLSADAVHAAALQERVDQLIRNYRVRGHMVADLDPLDQPRPHPPELDPGYYGFTDADLDREFSTRMTGGADVRPLREILRVLRNTYCGAIGVQFMHIDDLAVRTWLQDRMESTENHIELSREKQLRIFRWLTDAVVFEEFLQKKYLGAKSFSLEGAESLIPLLDIAIEEAADDGVEEIVLGMAHRGRLNVLANIIHKSPRRIFREFEDPDPHSHIGRGDVKYHLGESYDWQTSSGRRVHLSLCFNPSHLEYVSPVALGRMRAKQDRFSDDRRRRGLALLIHGDAAFGGEGVVQETLNLSELPAYSVGGSIHVVVNNQLGFTTTPEQGRSSVYCSDVARMLQIPVFHVNGEHPEAVAQVIHLAIDFRREFQRDVVIDMYCYRQQGHNEGDEPSFTQPVMYRRIKNRPLVRDSYLDHLLELGGITRDEAEQIAEERREHLAQELETARSDDFETKTAEPAGVWSGYRGGKETVADDVETGVERDRLEELLRAQTQFPEDFHPHDKLKRAMQRRRKMAAGETPLDWSAAEALALASLATEGVRIRMTGQDSERGTFSQRHAVLHDFEDGQTYVPLQHLADDQAPVEIANSPLSEAGVLGFEYGYSLDCPDGLILWEAQFGDFANAAQVIIDQFIASAEDKWQRLSGLVMLLPHGFEGQGPEHSSARIERFLMLAAEDNLQVVVPSTPAQYFHVLRRQALRRWRKPLVVLTPKSLLRDRHCVSTLDDLAESGFQRVLPATDASHDEVKRVLLCSGKIYYELAAQRTELDRRDLAIVRLEQLYPLSEAALQQALAGYAEGTPVTWVQEEPENMGAWRFLRVRFGENVFGRHPFAGVYRRESASPATGSKASHEWEQQQLIDRAFSGARV